MVIKGVCNLSRRRALQMLHRNNILDKGCITFSVKCYRFTANNPAGDKTFLSRVFCSPINIISQTYYQKTYPTPGVNSRTISVLSSNTQKRGQLKTMKLDTPAFQELFTPELNKLIELFKKYNYELRIAGGAVRDMVLGIIPHDIDFATTATPEEMKDMFEKEEIRMINARGESHGTITCRINDKENFEVTTLRIDVVTDGRRAQVKFTTDWQLDALRRDLTINAMFLGLDGTVYDYFNGIEDLQSRKLRFVGNPKERIQEDYLRILRYFRFYGRISDCPNSHEPETLAAIRENVDGMARISGERIWSELKKIVSGNHSASNIRIMTECGLAPFIGLPSSGNVDEFEKRWQLCKEHKPLPSTLLAALLDSEEQVYKLNERLKMSNFELRVTLFIVNHRDDEIDENKLQYCKNLMCDTAGKEPKTKEKIMELLKYCGHFDVIEQFDQWNLPKFPVRGTTLLEAGVPKGPRLAIVLSSLRQKWKESDFKYTEEELIQFVEEYKKK